MSALDEGPPRGGPEHRPAAGFRLPPIYVADDDPLSLQMVTLSLQLAGIVNPVESWTDGESLIEHLARRTTATAEPLPVMLILDVHMPGASGVEVLRAVRGHPLTASVPVILQTASMESQHLAEANALGVQACMLKGDALVALGDVISGLPLQRALLPASTS